MEWMDKCGMGGKSGGRRWPHSGGWVEKMEWEQYRKRGEVGGPKDRQRGRLAIEGAIASRQGPWG